MVNGVCRFLVVMCLLAGVALQPGVSSAAEAADHQAVLADKAAETDAARAHTDTGSCCIPDQGDAAAPNEAAPANLPCQHTKTAGQGS